MSLLTGEPKGRVVYVVRSAYDNTVARVSTFLRSDVFLVEASQHYSVTVTLNNDQKVGFDSAEDHDTRGNTQDAIISSIVDEDVDVVWTRYKGNYTRVPDRANK